MNFHASENTYAIKESEKFITYTDFITLIFSEVIKA